MILQMEKKIDIHKAGGILIQERRFLVNRSRGKDIFMSPGGKLESGETPEEALIRELNEELSIEVELQDLTQFGTFYAPAAGEEDSLLKMSVFLVNRWGGDIQPSSEIEEVLWINSLVPDGIKLGSIFEHEVLPRLKQGDLID